MSKNNIKDSELFDKMIKLKVRYGLTLFTISICIGISIFFFNNNLNDDAVEIERLENEIERKEKNLNRFLHLKYLDSSFYSEVTKNYLERAINNGTLFLDSCDLNYSINDSISNQDNQLDPKELNVRIDENTILEKNLDEFGVKMALFVKKDTFLTEPITEVLEILQNSFTDSIVVRYLRNNLILKGDSENRLPLKFNDNEWHHFSSSSFYMDYLMGVYDKGDTILDKWNSHSKISFLKRMKRAIIAKELKDRIVFEKQYALSLSVKSAENYFVQQYRLAHDTLLDFRRKDNSINIRSIGVKLNSSEIFIFAGIVVFFFLAIFYTYSFRAKKLGGNGIPVGAYQFPNFNSEGGPFESSPKKSEGILYYIKNFIWSLFIVMPLLILFIGYIYRYDVETVNEYGKYDACKIVNLIYTRSYDFPSIILDGINLLFLFAAIEIVLLHNMKSSDINYSKLFILKNGIALLIGSVFIHVIGYLCKIFPLKYKVDEYINYVYVGYLKYDPLVILLDFVYSFQVFMWFYFIFWSIKLKARLITVISIIALIYNFYMWIF